MSYSQYISRLQTYVNGLTTRAHGHINSDFVFDSAIARVQTDTPTLGIHPIGTLPNPPQGSLQLLGNNEAASVFVSHENPWWEDWVLSDLTLFQNPTPQLWKAKTGTTMKAALPNLRKTLGDGVARWLPMNFEYKALPVAPSLGNGLAAFESELTGVERHSHAFEVYNIVQGSKFEKIGGKIFPTGFLYRMHFPVGSGELRFVDYWLLRPEYRPPIGSRCVAVSPVADVPGKPSQWADARLAAGGGATADSTFVCTSVTAIPLP